MTTAVRVDASPSIGTGHVKRMLSLAKAIRSIGQQVVFIWRDLGLDCGSELDKAGFDHIRLPSSDRVPLMGADNPPHADWAGLPQAQDAKDTSDALKDFAVEWLIVDHYAFDARWHDRISEALKCRIAAIDDLADRPLAADLIVDHNFANDHREKYQGVADSAARILGGPRFALLDSTYSDAPRYAFSPEVRSIGVFMGGTDSTNASSTVLDALQASGFEGQIEVVTTTANPHLDRLRDRLAASGHAKLSCNLPDLAGFFARHDIQIGGGGGSTWERCCIGAPTLGIVVAQNQHAALAPLASRNILSMCAEPRPDIIAEQLNLLIQDPALRAHYAESSRQLVDGKGSERVAVAMFADRLTVRPATQVDSGLMFSWRNDPSVRAVSREKAVLDRLTHDDWVERTIASPDSYLMVAEIGDRAVGVIRYDAMPDDDCEVSLYIDPELNGLGLGKSLLRAGERSLRGARGIVAEVLSDNPASVKIFAASGYRERHPGHWYKPLS